MSTAPQATRAAVDRIRLRAMRPDLDVDAISEAEVAEHLDQIARLCHEHPAWLHRPRSAFGDLHTAAAVDVTAQWLAATARLLEDPSDPLATALGDVLANASGHLPEFGTVAGQPAPEPYGCIVCGGADGANACDTWEAGIALAKALLADPEEAPA